jgi:hypothetical protein
VSGTALFQETSGVNPANVASFMPPLDVGMNGLISRKNGRMKCAAIRMKTLA